MPRHANSGSFKKGRRPSGKPFISGQVPWNKGISMHLNAETEWKEGQTAGDKSLNWKGGVQHTVNDCVHLWAGPNKRVRRPRKVYEDACGKIPFGYVIWHKDGNKDNDELENLEAIPRSEALKRNNKDGGRWKHRGDIIVRKREK